MNFFAELKRQRLKQRKLVQWTVAYVAAAFALLQGIDIVAQQFGWPENIRRGITLAMVVGFFVTLVLAWYHGERGAQRVTGTELLILALLVSLGGIFLWRYTAAAPKEVSSTNPAKATLPLPSISAKSIAVLPFENLSEDKANAYFAEGIQDEILTRLAKVADLKVISRTSTQRFQSAPEDLPEIAKQLGVAHILEGTVQKSNDQVRVNVQLIKATTDAHLWAETYDRKLTDIFTVESEIAKTIAETLQAKLTGSEERAIAARPTDNTEAYQLYLQGRFFWNKRTAADLRKSIDLFNQAIAKDPGYALAYAGLAQTWSIFAAHNGAAPANCGPQADAAAMKALALDNTLSDAYAALAQTKESYHFDFAGAKQDYARALLLNPNDATAHHWFGAGALAATGEQARELAELERALELDPLSRIIQTNLGVAYIHSHRYDEAMDHFRKVIELDANFSYAYRCVGLALELQHKSPEAISYYEKAVALTDNPIELGMLGRIYGLTGRTAEAQKILEKLRQARADHYTAAYALAEVDIGLGDKAGAVYWLEQGYLDHDGDALGLIRVDPSLAQLHGDPRFEALAEKIVPASKFSQPPPIPK